MQGLAPAPTVTEFDIGLHNTFMQQSAMSLMCQYVLISKYYMYAVDPCEGSLFLPTEYYTGPCDVLIWQSAISLMGLCELIVQIFLLPKEYYAGPHRSLTWQPNLP